MAVYHCACFLQPWKCHWCKQIAWWNINKQVLTWITDSISNGNDSVLYIFLIYWKIYGSISHCELLEELRPPSSTFSRYVNRNTTLHFRSHSHMHTHTDRHVGSSGDNSGSSVTILVVDFECKDQVVITPPVQLLPTSSPPYTCISSPAKWPLDTYSSDNVVFMGISIISVRVIYSHPLWAWGCVTCNILNARKWIPALSEPYIFIKRHDGG